MHKKKPIKQKIQMKINETSSKCLANISAWHKKLRTNDKIVCDVYLEREKVEKTPANNLIQHTSTENKNTNYKRCLNHLWP